MRVESYRSPARPRGGRRREYAWASALRYWFDGADDQEHLGHRRYHLRRVMRVLPGTGRRAKRGRRRYPVARNGAGHAQLQGRADWNRTRDRKNRGRGRGRRFGHDRDDGHAARGPGYRGVLYLDRASRPSVDGPQLRNRSRLHDRPFAHAGRNRAFSCRLRAERRTSRRRGRYNETPEMLARKLERFVDAGWINVVGGCCGTTPEHIRILAQMLEGKRRREIPALRRSIVSGIEALVIDENTRPVVVGERTNVLGSRKFKRLVTEGKIEEAAEVGRHQV